MSPYSLATLLDLRGGSGMQHASIKARTSPALNRSLYFNGPCQARRLSSKPKTVLCLLCEVQVIQPTDTGNASRDL